MSLAVQIEQCRGQQASVILSENLPVQTYQLEFTRHCGVLQMLEDCTQRPPHDRILGLVLATLLGHGWKKTSPWTGSNNSAATDYVEPIPQAPKIHYFRLYNLMAIDGDQLQRLVHLADPTFNLLECMLRYCADYRLEIDKTFPSARHRTCNRIVRAKKMRKQLHGEEEDTGRLYMIKGPDEPFIYDNDAINTPHPVAPETATTTKRSKYKYQRFDENGARFTYTREYALRQREFPRLIPVTVLPLFLTYLPTCYTRVNTILHACEQMEESIWAKFHTLAYYESYMAEQVDAITQNRRFTGFAHQCTHLLLGEQAVRPLDAYERSLHANELLHLRLLHQDVVECATAEIDRLRALLAKATGGAAL